MKLFAALVLVVCTHATPLPPPRLVGADLSIFGDFSDRFSKKYSSDKEFADRFAIYKSNRGFIDGKNSLDLPYKLAVNNFADMTQKEIATSYMGVLPHMKEELEVQRRNITVIQVKDSVDWVSAGAVTPVKDQGSCGSCWAFSTTGALEGALKVSSGSLVSLSEQQIVDCVKPKAFGCTGGWPEDAMLWAESNNVCTENGYPDYSHKQDPTPLCYSCGHVGLESGTVSSWQRVDRDMQSMMSALSGQPVSIVIDASGSFYFYDSGILSEFCGGGQNHAVLAVGYGTDSSLNRDYWKVKNSWGTSWGENGYIRLSRGYDGKKTLDFVTLGGFSDYGSSHGFLGMSFTDSGETANSAKIYSGYYGKENTNYYLYKCSDGSWIVTSADSFDATSCSGYAYTEEIDLSTHPKGWFEWDASSNKFVQNDKAGVTDWGTVESECAILKHAVYPVISACNRVAPSGTCNVGDCVCAGNQCCPSGDTCPSAETNFTSCAKPKSKNLLKSLLVSV